MSTGIGDTLHEAREAQGRSLEDAAQAVRARTAQLQALEEERFDNFGGHVYAKGFLKSYALELGLDPGPLLSSFDEAVGANNESVSSSMVRPVKTPGPKGTTPPAWAAWALVAVVVIAGLYFLGLISPRTPDGQAGEDVGTPPVSPAEEETDEPSDEPEDEGDEAPEEDEGSTEEPDEPDESDEPDEPDEPAFEGAEVILAFEGDSWMRVTVDGAVLQEETVPAGETLRFEGDEVIVRIGYASRVRIQYNGEDLGTAGGAGEVVELRFTEEGFEEV